MATRSSISYAWEIPWTESQQAANHGISKELDRTDDANTYETYRNVICLISAHFKDFDV